MVDDDDAFDSVRLPPEGLQPRNVPTKKAPTPIKKPVKAASAPVPEAVAPPKPAAPAPPPEEPPSLAPKSKFSARPAREVCQHFALSDDARALLTSDMTSRKFLEALAEKELFADAMRFLAHALPKREAVWWSCQCVRESYGAKPPAEVGQALQAAEKWASDPTEQNRRAALPAAETAEIGTPASCAAAAAFWSGGSLGPPQAPEIPPGEFLTARGVAGAVLLAAVLTEPEKAPDKFRQFLGFGVEVANGTRRWQKSS